VERLKKNLSKRLRLRNRGRRRIEARILQEHVGPFNIDLVEDFEELRHLAIILENIERNQQHDVEVVSHQAAALQAKPLQSHLTVLDLEDELALGVASRLGQNPLSRIKLGSVL
jgi:hypothetical protein